MRTASAVLAAIAAVSVAVDVPPVGPTFLPPAHGTPARCDVPRGVVRRRLARERLPLMLLGGVRPQVVSRCFAKAEAKLSIPMFIR